MTKELKLQIKLQKLLQKLTVYTLDKPQTQIHYQLARIIAQHPNEKGNTK
jgi:hypothetical protein